MSTEGMYPLVFGALGFVVRKSKAEELEEQDHDRFSGFLGRSALDMNPWQWEGVQWALCLERNGHVVGNDTVEGVSVPRVVRGGLLADEMGLGKTIQMIGTILCNPLARTLVVVPRALLEQWESTIMDTTGHAPLVYHGASRRELSLEDISSRAIVITTYHLVATKIVKGKDGKKKVVNGSHGTLLHGIKWNRIIFDEAHHLRNEGTSIAAGAKKLKSDVRWLVTGTPIQNRKKDFYSLCEQMGLPSSYYADSANLMDLVRNFIKKRTKLGVGVSLPALSCETEMVGWQDKSEKALAENIHALLQFSKVDKKHIDNTIAKMEMPSLALLIRARQVCVFPSLIKSSMNGYISSGLIEESDTMMTGTCGSSKLSAVLNKIVSRRDNGKAKLVFCHFRGEIDYIEAGLSREGLNVSTFDGRVKESERRQILEGECDVLVLQIQTGCEGLNLQQFSEIYFVSPHWNPAVEDQAVARCHRIGQSKEVEVFRFMMSGFDEDEQTQTLDSYSAKVQEVKREVMTILDDDADDADKKTKV